MQEGEGGSERARKRGRESESKRKRGMDEGRGYLGTRKCTACSVMVNGPHLYSAFIQSDVQFMPLIHPHSPSFTRDDVVLTDPHSLERRDDVVGGRGGGGGVGRRAPDRYVQQACALPSFRLFRQSLPPPGCWHGYAGDLSTGPRVGTVTRVSGFHVPGPCPGRRIKLRREPKEGKRGPRRGSGCRAFAVGNWGRRG